jgi:hypothetical protein
MALPALSTFDPVLLEGTIKKRDMPMFEPPSNNFGFPKNFYDLRSKLKPKDDVSLEGV